jgi:hypothetical protein
VAGLDAILAVHLATLEQLKLDNVPRGRTCHELARGPKYKLSKLKSPSIANFEASEPYLRRVSNSPIRFLEVIPIPSLIHLVHRWS